MLEDIVYEACFNNIADAIIALNFNKIMQLKISTLFAGVVVTYLLAYDDNIKHISAHK